MPDCKSGKAIEHCYWAKGSDDVREELLGGKRAAMKLIGVLDTGQRSPETLPRERNACVLQKDWENYFAALTNQAYAKRETKTPGKF